MEFDPRMTEETKKFVEQASVYYKLAFSNTTDIKEIRKYIDSIDDETNKNYKNENIVEKELLILNPKDNFQVPVTIYTPKNVSNDSSIVVFFIGSGWTCFSRKTYKRSVSYLAEHSNKIWVSVGYRLSPEYKHPVAIEDCCSVIQWISENKLSYFNCSENAKLGVIGDSAGGHLGACVAQRLRHLLSFQILIFPCLDLTCTADSYREFSFEKYLLSKEILEQLLSNYTNNVEERKLPEVSPLLNNDLDGLPKCFLLSAELDPLVGDSYAYHKKLIDRGLNSKLHIIKGVVHGFIDPYLDYKNAFLEAANQIVQYLNDC